MKNKKGQALVEFVLILPILIIILFAIIEFGNMMNKKYKLQTDLENVIEIYKSGKEEVLESYEDTNDITVNFEQSGNLVNTVITKKVKLVTPGLNMILTNPYTIKVERKFYVDDTNTETSTEDNIDATE